MAFQDLAELIAQAETEQAELDQANETLEAAKADLAEAQTVVSSKQQAVDQARQLATTEKADVIGKLTSLLEAVNEKLAQLQA